MRLQIGTVDIVEDTRVIVRQTVEDNVTGLAAQLAYRFFLALFTFFIFISSLSAFVASVFNIEEPAEKIVALFGESLPPGANELLRAQLEQVVGSHNPGLLSIGVIGAIFAATGGTNALVKVLNRAYDVEETRPFWLRYLMAVGLTVTASLTVVLGFAFFLLGDFFVRQVASWYGVEGELDWLMWVLRWPAALFLVFIGSALLYWRAPNLDLRFVLVLPGAFLFTVGWVAATYVFSFYVSNFGSFDTTYGTLGGVTILLIWFYITAFALLVGAEVNGVIDTRLDPERVEGQSRHTKDKKAEQEREKAAKDRRQGREPRRERSTDAGG